MYDNELLGVYRLREKNFNQGTPTETKAIAVKSDGTKPNIVITPEGATFLGFFGFSTLGIVFFLMFPRLRKVAQDKTGTIQQLDRFPCRNCRYFTDSLYLKCAVHPDTALTKRAIDCPDYCNR